jgi:predicted metal-dependent peptidase
VDQYWNLYYHPDWIPRLSIPELGTVLYHEVLHLLRDHHSRAQALGVNALNQEAWNVAADAEMNDDIRKEGFPFPTVGKDGRPFSPVFPESLKQPEGLLAEEYYRNLPQIDLKALLAQAGVGDQGEGSGVTGVPAPWEPGDGDKNGISPTQAEVLREAVARAIEEHAAKHPGSVPGHLERWARERKRSKVDWRRELRSLLRMGLASAQGQVDYRFDRPNRRQAVSRFILPRLRGPQPRLGLAVDTSGSMSDQELAQALAEIEGVVKAFGVPVDVASGDVGLQTFQRGLFRASQVRLTGDGGTDMGLLLRQFGERAGVKYHCVVLISDFYTPWPEKNPLPCPVIGVALGKDAPVQDAPSWIRVVHVKDL